MAAVSTARRTLGRWILTAFLERGCDPTTARIPRRVQSIRPLSPGELAELNPLLASLVPLTNLRRLPSWRVAARPQGVFV